MDNGLNDRLNAALAMWLSATGANPEQTRFRVRLGSDWDEYKVHKATEELAESRDLDPSGLTTLLLLKAMTESFLAGMSFPVMAFISAAEESSKRVQLLTALWQATEGRWADEMSADFVRWARDAVLHFGLPAERSPELDAMLADARCLAFLRRDALRASRTLRVDQFAYGPPGGELKFSSEILGFWNVRSLLEFLQHMPVDGISLNVIQDPSDVAYTYFAVGVRSGGSITVLSDRPDMPHPLAAELCRPRGGGRRFMERVGRYRFPYERCVKVEFSDGDRHVRSASRGIVPVNADPAPVARFSDLPCDELLWLAMLFDCVRERFGRLHERSPNLSYTADMIRDPHTLIGDSSSLIASGAYAPLTLLPVRVSDLEPEKLRDQWDRPPSGHHQWMVERYGQIVPEKELNAVGDEEARELAAQISSSGLAVATLSSSASLALASGTFGTAAEIERDRRWVARCQQVRHAQKGAQEEFDRAREEALLWIRDRLRSRADELVSEAVRSVCLPVGQVGPWPAQRTRLTQSSRKKFFMDGPPVDTVGHLERGSALMVPRNSHISRGVHANHSGSFLLSGGIIAGAIARDCYDAEEVTASRLISYRPDDPSDLSIMLGVPVDELPWFLRNWHRGHRFDFGNPLLDRLDPADWAIEDPWGQLPLSLHVFLSRRSFQARRRKAGLSRVERQGYAHAQPNHLSVTVCEVCAGRDDGSLRGNTLFRCDICGGNFVTPPPEV